MPDINLEKINLNLSQNTVKAGDLFFVFTDDSYYKIADPCMVVKFGHNYLTLISLQNGCKFDSCFSVSGSETIGNVLRKIEDFPTVVKAVYYPEDQVKISFSDK